MTSKRPASLPPLVLTDIKLEVEHSRDDDITTRPVMNHHYHAPPTLLPVLYIRQQATMPRPQPSLPPPLQPPPPLPPPQSSSSTSLTEHNRIKIRQISEKPPFKKPLRPILPKKDNSFGNNSNPGPGPPKKKRRNRNSKADTLLCHICGEMAR